MVAGDMRRMVAYYGNRYLDHFARDLVEIREHGFDTVVHCVSEADYEWGMRRMAELFAMTRDAGLSCWVDPWGVAGLFGGEAHSGYLGRGGSVVPEDPGLRALLRNWLDAVAAAGAEWVFWDEPNLGLAGARTTEFLATLATQARNRGLRNSVCLTSTVANRQALRDLAACEAIDDVGTDPYYKLELDYRDPDPEDYVGVWAQFVREAAEAHGKTSHIWVQAFNIAEGQEQRVGRCISAARSRGVSGIGVWAFRACESLAIRPARADVAWEEVRRALAPE
jgi:hypothetical protein